MHFLMPTNQHRRIEEIFIKRAYQHKRLFFTEVVTTRKHTFIQRCELTEGMTNTRKILFSN